MSEAVVVGGGPAGSSCALALARAGVAVTLIERQHFPRRKVCGEYLSVGALDELDALGLFALVAAAGGRLRGVRIAPPGSAPLELPFPTNALACERSVLDAVLLDAARKAGVVVVQAHAVGVTFEGDRAAGIVTRDGNGERGTVAARFVIGADGAGSLVARKLGLVRRSAGSRRFALGGHYRGLGSFDGCVEMYVGRDAYVALNPLDEERCNAMIVVSERDVAQWARPVDTTMAERARALSGGRRSFANARRIGARVCVGPLAFRVRAVTRPGALLVGDAAGFLDPFTGQGVLLALRGARCASEAILASLRRRGSERTAMATYAAQRERDLRLRRRLSRLVDLLVDVPFLSRRSAQRLRARPELAATLLGALAGGIAPERALRPAFLGGLLL
ncbi:MAG: NAD(P)/FAD-dependent oxidoreductase [Candidatus Eremiobacteraeota bacterium]|nr:NAD(P)/FAD-dependent oxidoreductase [Candidatus Eremiobacteraeota bacterium]